MSYIRGLVAAILCQQVAQVIIAAILLVGTFILLIRGMEVPEWLVVLDTAAATFYFTNSLYNPSNQ